MSDYLKQNDHQSKQELIKSAVDYFWELKSKQKLSLQKAKETVLHKTGIVL